MTLPGLSQAWKGLRLGAKSTLVGAGVGAAGGAVAGGEGGRLKGALVGGALGGGAGYGVHRARASVRPSWAKGVGDQRSMKSAYKTQARKVHPDMGGSTDAMQGLTKEWGDFQNSYAYRNMKTAQISSFFDEIEKIASEIS